MDENAKDINFLTLEELRDVYLKLRECCRQQLVTHEDDTQRIYQLQRNLATAMSNEAYLEQELEQLSKNESTHTAALVQKKQNEIDELKRKQKDLTKENEELAEEIASLSIENKNLKAEIKELTAALTNDSSKVTNVIPQEYKESKERLEAENMDLLVKLSDIEDNVTEFTLSLAEKETHIAVLRDQVHCLEENLQKKREELDEKSQLLESAQEQMGEMLTQLASTPQGTDRKGNSLFAEVDDQRQVLKKRILLQKNSYQELKKALNDSICENSRLKKENVAIQNELRACSRILSSADKTYKEKLSGKIVQLRAQNEDQNKIIENLQKEFLTMANRRGVTWAESLLTFCKTRGEKLQQELQGYQVQLGILEKELRNSQRCMARWRFEALKNRYILSVHEALLSENNIKFKTFKSNSISISLEALENAQPDVEFSIYPTIEMDMLKQTGIARPYNNIEKENVQPRSDEPIVDSQLDGNNGSEKKDAEVKQTSNFETAFKYNKERNDSKVEHPLIESTPSIQSLKRRSFEDSPESDAYQTAISLTSFEDNEYVSFLSPNTSIKCDSIQTQNLEESDELETCGNLQKSILKERNASQNAKIDQKTSQSESETPLREVVNLSKQKTNNRKMKSNKIPVIRALNVHSKGMSKFQIPHKEG